MIVIANLFPKLQTVKDLVRQPSKSAVSIHLLTVNMLRGPKHLWNLHESTFIIPFHHYDANSFDKYLP